MTSQFSVLFCNLMLSFRMKRSFILAFWFLISTQLLATHIVGGEILYDHLGGNDYRITLKIYRDCSSLSPFDGNGVAGPAYITVFDASYNVEGVIDIGAPVITVVPPAFNNPCINAPNNICIEEGVYTYTLNLPPKTGGYLIVYQRCCRNANIINLVNSNANNEGATYFTKIPGPEEVLINNSPRFTKFPPIYICRDVRLKFDHSASDPDGDQLVYSLTAPFAGLDGCCAAIKQSGTPGTSSNCPNPPAICPQNATLPPYPPVLFLSPFSGSYPIPSNPAFSINPVTGELSGTPTMVAQYAVGVQVQEYRNNVLINTHFRDFQFTVIGCTVNVLSAVADQTPQCKGQNLSFINKSLNNSATPVYHWDFGVPTISTDTSNLFSPSYFYPDTGIYILSLITNPGKPCSDTLKKEVYVYPPLEVKFLHPGRQCFKNNAFNFSPQGTFAAQASFTWNFSGNANPTVAVVKNIEGVNFLQGGLFTVTLQAKQFACRDTFMDTVRVIGRPKAKINNLPGKLCDPAWVGFSNGSSGELPLKYYWSFSNGETSTEFEPKQLFTPAGNYEATLIVETEILCKDTSVYKISPITIYPKPNAGFIVSPKETSIFEPYIQVSAIPSSENPLSRYFTFGDGSFASNSSTIHTYEAFGNYTITQIVTNTYGCQDTAYESVKILTEFRFWIPNTFTPDNNNLNDVFMPVTFGISNYSFEIFNSWGQLVFKTKNTEEGWNGTYKNTESPQGTYIWKISYKNPVTENTEEKAGHLILLRSP
jgi:gliding motility-associated-like protein